jgi:hypothetical protein
VIETTALRNAALPPTATMRGGHERPLRARVRLRLRAWLAAARFPVAPRREVNAPMDPDCCQPGCCEGETLRAPRATRCC